MICAGSVTFDTLEYSCKPTTLLRPSCMSNLAKACGVDVNQNGGAKTDRQGGNRNLCRKVLHYRSPSRYGQHLEGGCDDTIEFSDRHTKGGLVVRGFFSLECLTLSAGTDRPCWPGGRPQIVPFNGLGSLCMTRYSCSECVGSSSDSFRMAINAGKVCTTVMPFSPTQGFRAQQHASCLEEL